MKTTLKMELISARTDPSSGAGGSLVLWAEHGVQRVWQCFTGGGGTVQQSDPKRFSLEFGDSKKSSKSIDRKCRKALVSRPLAVVSRQPLF